MTEIRPFHIDVPDDMLDDLRRRIGETRWPNKELVTDRTQGVQLATMQELAHYWTNEYDLRRCAARLNALPQFKTEIDGVEIHFIHVKSRHENALPLIMTHGWPGSVIELLETVGPLTDPTAHGGTPEDAFHLVLPSLPGYGFSGEPAELGWDSGRTARAWAELMHRLGYTRYVAQGGDVGALVTDLMGRQAVQGLVGYHVNLLTAALAIGDHLPKESDKERVAAVAFAKFKEDGFGYFLEMATRPQTISYAMLDSPVALAAWLLDHDTDSYYKISDAFVNKDPSGNLTRDNILDNITLYWLTGTAASAARSYWEDGRALAAALASGQPPPPVSVPVGFTTFPGEIWASPRSWVQAVYPDLAYFSEVDKGGHFAAWEEPDLFARELRARVPSAAIVQEGDGAREFAVSLTTAYVDQCLRDSTNVRKRGSKSAKLGRFRSDAARLRFLAAYDAAIEKWPTPPRHHDVPTTFGTTHVLQSGSLAGAPIVLLHAIAVSSPAWYPDIAALGASHPVYAIDTITDPGRSSQSAPVRNGDDFAAWLTEVLDALHLDGVHVVGLSYGGWLALNQAHRVPNGIASVTSVDPVGALGRPKTSFMVKIVPDSVLALAKSEKAIHRLMARLNNGAVPGQPLLDLSVAGLRTFVAKQPFPKRMTDDELRRITVPTLLILCARSPVNDTQGAAQRSRACIAGVEVDVVADSGHMLPIEHPEQFTRRVLSFVGGLETSHPAPEPHS